MALTMRFRVARKVEDSANPGTGYVELAPALDHKTTAKHFADEPTGTFPLPGLSSAAMAELPLGGTIEMTIALVSHAKG